MFLLVSRYIVLSFLFLNPIYSETQDNQEGSLTLSLELYDRSTGNLILREEASSLYGVVQAVTPY
ncbi:hypothetical protein N9440_01065 [Alphaproteobacteria bacterium]|nr:hypothetical protein [Alphaproteobacteria bacterium]